MFQSAPPCGGRPSPFLPSVPSHQFQSAPPCGGRPDAETMHDAALPFQSAPPCGGRPVPQSASSSQAAALFQSAPPCGGRPGWSTHITTPTKGFNPRPRAGGDPPSSRPDRPPWSTVSIRAPVRGATRRSPRPFRCRSVSIRAPVRGATRPTDSVHGRRSVSIRAPVRGATSEAVVPRPVIVFQSAPPCGGRLVAQRDSALKSIEVSIRAPVRGATAGGGYP